MKLMDTRNPTMTQEEGPVYATLGDTYLPTD
jgi:hypothetical protein